MQDFKKIGIIFALKREFKGFTSSILNNLQEINLFPFYTAKSNHKDIELIYTVSGLGKARASACTQHIIDRYNPELIINVGSAGGVCTKVKIADIYFATTLIEYDFKSLKEKTPILSISVDLINTAQKCNLCLGVLGSADQNADSLEKKEMLHRLGITIADWEGAAVVKTCLINRTKVAVMKTITDTSNIDFAKEFSENAFKFNERLYNIVINFIEKFYEY